MPTRPIVPVSVVATWSDASNYAWGGYTICSGRKLIARGGWPAEVVGLSSTFRGLRATRLVLDTLAKSLEFSTVIHRTDNQAAAQILANGSKHQHLHEEAVTVFHLLEVQHSTLRGMGTMQTK